MTINFGIDLGTTNSVIAKFHEGSVEIFKNPIGHKETLPSVVAFRKERILVGDKAREYLEKDPDNVFGSFKRKMGTSESFFVMNLERTITPVELSSLVLKELKNFVYTGEKLDAAVITIPASFDTVQSNATKKAGLEAGFEEVLLLQEPIAASLAYANKSDNALQDGQWLVYDLGGGTFDVALVKIADGEMKVTDHQGDNFLGGVDFDNLIIEQIIVPYLNATGQFENLEQELRSARGKYNKLYYKLLLLAEDAKVALSGTESTDIEFEIEDKDGEEMDVYISIHREEFEDIIRDKIQDTIQMIRLILDRNSLLPSDIRFVLMVGGSTYIPLVRKLIAQELGIEVNCGVDPTDAVAVGAAFYAGTRVRQQKREPSENSENSFLKSNPGVFVKTAYQRTSQSEEEYFTAQVDGSTDGLFYRIVRSDGGFDSGLKKLESRIFEQLPLVKDSYNYFTLKIYDSLNNQVEPAVPNIEIVHGKFNVLGQPLPNDICLEIDDFENGGTKLEVIFEKNALLPLRRVVTKEIMRTVSKGSNDSVVINVLEGNRFAAPATNLPIGTIEVKGKELTRDLVKGSDIEVTLEMTESRELKITTYLLMTDQEFQNTFNPSERTVNLFKLRDEITELNFRLKDEFRNAESNEEYELAAQLQKLNDQVAELNSIVRKLSEDDVTDSRYQLEDRKRKLASELDNITKDKHLTVVKTEYFQIKGHCETSVEANGSEEDKKYFKDAVAHEKEVLASGSKIAIEDLTEKLNSLRHRLDWKTPHYVISLFYYYSSILDKYIDKARAKSLIEKGEKALERQNYDEVRVVIVNLFNLLPEENKGKEMRDSGFHGTGIG
jgi:molecular chaperone DnaK